MEPEGAGCGFGFSAVPLPMEEDNPDEPQPGRRTEAAAARVLWIAFRRVKRGRGARRVFIAVILLAQLLEMHNMPEMNVASVAGIVPRGTKTWIGARYSKPRLFHVEQLETSQSYRCVEGVWRTADNPA